MKKLPTNKRKSSIRTALRRYKVWRFGKHVGLILLLLAYAFLGAFLFSYVEAPAEAERNAARLAEHARRRNELLLDVEEITTELTDVSRARLAAAIAQFEELYTLNDTALSQKYEWDFWNAMFYSGTIFTTIGYGHLYCQTFTGQVLTMVYALFGIPIVLTVLKDLGSCFFYYASKLYNKMIRCCLYGVRRIHKCCLRKEQATLAHHDDSDSEDERFDIESQFPLTLALAILVIYTFVCASLFKLWETEWDYFTAFYFFFITLSTIGLGDIYPNHPRYTIIAYIFVIIGLSLVSMCLNIIQNRVERHYNEAVTEIQERLDLESSEDEEEVNISRDTYHPEAKAEKGAVLGIMQVRRLGSHWGASKKDRRNSSRSNNEQQV